MWAKRQHQKLKDVQKRHHQKLIDVRKKRTPKIKRCAKKRAPKIKRCAKKKAPNMNRCANQGSGPAPPPLNSTWTRAGPRAATSHRASGEVPSPGARYNSTGSFGEPPTPDGPWLPEHKSWPYVRFPPPREGILAKFDSCPFPR